MLTNGDEILKRVRAGQKLVVGYDEKGKAVGHLVTDKAHAMYIIENVTPSYYFDNLKDENLKRDPDIIQSLINGFERLKGYEKNPIKIEQLDAQIEKYTTLLEEVKGKQR